MKDRSTGYMPRNYTSDRRERHSLLAVQLEASAGRICDLQDRLMAGTSALKPIEYDRLLDDYRAELVRYDRIDRELVELEAPTKTKEYIEGRRIYQQYKNKINY